MLDADSTVVLNREISMPAEENASGSDPNRFLYNYPHGKPVQSPNAPEQIIYSSQRRFPNYPENLQEFDYLSLNGGRKPIQSVLSSDPSRLGVKCFSDPVPSAGPGYDMPSTQDSLTRHTQSQKQVRNYSSSTASLTTHNHQQLQGNALQHFKPTSMMAMPKTNNSVRSCFPPVLLL